MTDIAAAIPDDELTVSLADAERRLPALMRIKACRDQLLPVGNTKFYELANAGKIELVYVEGIAYVVTRSVLKLIAESPKKLKPPGGNLARLKKP